MTSRAPDRPLRVSEVYASIQGESTWAGLPCVFVRLTGCNLRCTWCDSAFTFKGGTRRSVPEVVEEVLGHDIELVEVTGGEPLLQPSSIDLMEALLAAGRTVLLETSGSLDITAVPAGVRVILDFKPPDSGEEGANLWSNVERLRSIDEVKFVLASRGDYEWAREVIRRHGLSDRCTVLLSTVAGRVAPADVVHWMLSDGLRARFQLQLHKYIWPAEARGV